MDRETFIRACNTIIEHDKRLRRINDFLSKDDYENGEGMFTYLPSTDTKLRILSIELLSAACGLREESGLIEYYFNECLTMKGGGSQTNPDGTFFKLETPEDLWAAVEHEMKQG
jgi:hypothetical protein